MVKTTGKRKLKEATAKAAREAKIVKWTIDLASDDGAIRQKARRAILELGASATPALIEVLSSSNAQARWEAAKALSDWGDPRSVLALVDRLEDSNSGIRWLAADGLMMIGAPALAPVLRALIERSDSILLRRSARRVLYGLVGRKGLSASVAPVLEALNAVAPGVVVPFAAQAALDARSRRSR